jgi:hypothetical protein
MRAQPLVVGLAGKPDHTRARLPGQLHRDRPDAPGCARDRDRLSRRECDRAHSRVCGCAYDEKATRDLPGHARRAMREVLGLYEHELGVAGPVFGEPDHLIPDAKALDPLAEPLDYAGEVAALAGGKRGRPALVHAALANRDLPRVDARRPDPHKRLACFRHRSRHIHHLQHLESAISIEPHRSHRVSFFVVRGVAASTASSRPGKRACRSSRRRLFRRAVPTSC